MWKDIPGYEGRYQVSNFGEVRSLLGKKPLIMKSTPDKDGYLLQPLFKDGKYKTHKVHHLVLTAFVGPKPEGGETCHGNGRRDDNRLVNLRWGTRKDNHRDQVEHGTYVNPMTVKTHCKRDHPFNDENTYIRDGKRHCRTCRREQMRRQRET